jgi:predicted deacylase
MIGSLSHRSQPTWRLLRALTLTLFVWSAVWGIALADDTPPVRNLTLGASTQGRPIEAVRWGDGPRKLVLVGATHGAPERNTFELSLQLIAYFRANPGEVPRDVSMYIVPALNPDGLAINSRRNARDVDLNRNMNTSTDNCSDNDWRQTINGAYGVVSNNGGAYEESETESRLIRDFLLDADGVIFFHSNAGVVFPACDHEPSQALGRTFATAAKYEYIPVWDRYVITGGMHDWAGGLDIPAITPELITGELPEFEQNLAGVLAVLRDAETLLPEPQAREVNGVEVQPVIWRAWRAWGGDRVWGNPLAPPQQSSDGWEQIFERARFLYRPGQSDSRAVVELSPLGQQFGSKQRLSVGRNAVANPDLATPEPDGVFAQFWERRSGSTVFGAPVAAPEEVEVNGERVVRQTFGRVIMERPADADQIEDVRLVPLGRIVWAQQDAQSAETGWRAR